MTYAELQVTTNFSFLRGASHPGELVVTAAALSHQAIAITDRNSLAGIVRAHHAAKEVGLRLVVGCRLDLRDGTVVWKDSSRSVSLRSAAGKMPTSEIAARTMRVPDYEKARLLYGGVDYVELAVDMETGRVHIEKV